MNRPAGAAVEGAVLGDKAAAQGKKTEHETGGPSSKDASETTTARTSVGAATSSSAAERPAPEKDGLYDASSRDAESAREVKSAQDNRGPTAGHEDHCHGDTAAAVTAGTAGAGGLAWAMTDPILSRIRHPTCPPRGRQRHAASRDSALDAAAAIAGDREAAGRQAPHLDHQREQREESESDNLPDSSDDEDEERIRQGGTGDVTSSSKSEELSEAEQPVLPWRDEDKREEYVPTHVFFPPPKATEDEIPASTTAEETNPTLATSTAPSESAAAQAPTVTTGPSSTERHFTRQ